MPRISKTSLSDITSLFGLIHDVHNNPINNARLYICGLGFEDRCLSFPTHLANCGFKSDRAVYLEYDTNRSDNQTNLPGLTKALSEISSNCDKINIDTKNSSDYMRREIETAINASNGTMPDIVFDISVTANRLIMKCMKVLLEYDVRLRLLYAEAGVYFPTKSEYELNPLAWATDDILGLERGVGNVEISVEWPGQHLDQLPDALIIFPCFKQERCKAVMSMVDPSLLTSFDKEVHWMLGRPHLEEDNWRLKAMLEINGITENMPQHQVSTFEYRDALRTLEMVYRQLTGEYRITLAPMGSKLQAVGASLFCYMHPDVRVIVAAPKEYNAKQYSSDCKSMWTFDLGETRLLREALDQVGCLKLDE